MTPATQLTPQPVPPPAGFPVDLEGLDALMWTRDRMHFPGQVSTLEADLVAEAIGRGATHALRHYDQPARAMHARVVNGYTYNAIEPILGPTEQMADLEARAETAMRTAIGTLASRWEHDWLPEISEHLAAMAAVDLAAAPTGALLAHLAECRRRLGRLWELHFEIVFPSYIAVSEFDELYRDLFAAEGFEAYTLLHGFESRTVSMGRDQWRLSRLALDAPEVMGVLDREAAADVPGVLATSAAGRAFLAELDAHLAEFGHRNDAWGLRSESFIEDPSRVIKVITDYASQPDSADPGRELERLAAAREEAVAAARAQLTGYPAPIVDAFEGLLSAAQTGLLLSEDHGYYIDAYGVDLMRQVIVAAGRRLVAEGALLEADDVFWLTFDELRDGSHDAPGADRRALVALRRAETARYATAEAPPVLGSLPPGPPPESPFTRLMAKFQGVPAEPGDVAEGVLRGAAGSSGTVTATARVVRSLSDAARLAPGEVLVCETTAPSWTPLFAVAGAVVTDTGGVLSHCAVVAREYGLPAVVGTDVATIRIADGDTVEVDGDAGTVRIV